MQLLPVDLITSSFVQFLDPTLPREQSRVLKAGSTAQSARELWQTPIHGYMELTSPGGGARALLLKSNPDDSKCMLSTDSYFTGAPITGDFN